MKYLLCKLFGHNYTAVEPFSDTLQCKDCYHVIEPEKESEECRWIPDEDGFWDTSCGRAWVSPDGNSPIFFSIQFCHGCGKKVRFAAMEEE